MKNKVWLLVVTLFVVHYGYAWEGTFLSETIASIEQQSKVRKVSGTVTDASGPVIGATVKVKNTKTGTITDFDGHFTLNIPVGATLVVSYIGYAEKEVVFRSENDLKIHLSENVQTLEEVQIIAYGSAKKVTITGAISSINSDDILKTPAGSITNALSGKIPGLSSVQGTGEPGADDATLYVRGVGSLSEGLSAPLVLVDGVERSFSQLDPNEIDDITVLKDASATAVFGVRGANGVILVTTKRGREGKARINFSTSFALQMPTRIPEFANSYEYATIYNQASLDAGTAKDDLPFTPEMLEGYKNHTNPYLYPDVNWADYMLKKSAPQTQHNFSISGGTKSVRYFMSLGVFTQDGLFKTFETDYNSGYRYNRYNYRINLDIDLTKSTLMKINLGGMLNNKRSPNYNNGTSTDLGRVYGDIYSATPFCAPGIIDGKYVTADPLHLPTGFQPISPIGNVYGYGYNTVYGNTLNFDFSLEQKLDFLTKGLKASIKGSYNSGTTQTKKRSGSGDMYEAAINADGSVNLKKKSEKSLLNYTEGFGKSRDWYVEAALNYQRNFGVHHFSALAMYNQTMKYYLKKVDYPEIPRAYVGFVGRVTYDYNTRYMADFSVGYNGSENFAPGHRFGLFPAGSLGWIVSEEKIMRHLKPYVSYLKLRVSYGVVGNDLVSGSERFLYLPDVYSANNGNYYNFGIDSSQKVVAAEESKKGNPNVTWETAAKQNYGVDLYLFDDRLKTTFDYFIEHRKDILLSRKILPGFLSVELPTMNLGKVDNKGYEISVKWEDKVKDFGYYIGVNLSYAKNTVVYQDEIPQPYSYMELTGKPVGSFQGYTSDGFFTEEEVANYAVEKGKTIPDYGDGFEPHAGDAKYKDLNHDNKVDYLDKGVIGYPKYPLFTGGLNFGFSYKGFDLSTTWQGAAKASRMLEDIWRNPFGALNTQSLLSYHVDNAWTPEKGNSAQAPKISFHNKTHNYDVSDLWLRDASYIRLKNIEVGYTLPKSIVQKMHISQFRIYLSGYNLFTFDKFGILDPETANTYFGNYPVVKVVNLGIKLSF